METKDNALTVVQGNEELAKLYGESAQLGSENLQGQIPMLKVHTTNKSQGNLLLNGKEPNDGWFFLTGSQEQFENPTCHVLTISRGFRSEGMVDKVTGKKGEDKFNQILGGVIVDGTDYKPFLMYFTGIKLQKLWDFGKEVSKYTNAKPVGIPMFALTVKLSTVKVKHDYGSSYAVDFEVVKNGDFPALVTDTKQFVFLRTSLLTITNTINSLIDLKSTEDKAVNSPDPYTKEAETVFVGEGGLTKEDLETEEEKIPF